nr:odorant-binding protein 28 [Diaphania glauculalis]
MRNYINMFKLLLISCYIAMSHQGRTPLEIRQYMLTQSIECTQTNFLNSSELQMLMNHELPNTKSSKCFIACIFKKMGWLNDKGMYDQDAANKFAEEEYVDDATQLENAKKLFDICKPVNDETPEDGEAGCDRANSLARCLIDNAPKMGFHIALGEQSQ